MKNETFRNNGLGALLIVVLASIGVMISNPAYSATMASYVALPSLDAGVDKPTAVAVDNAGQVYVAESMNNRVRIFSQSGAQLAEIPGIAKPISVAVDAAGRIHVGSAWQGSVAVFDSGRNFLFKLGAGDGEFIEPADIDIDASGQVYVTDKDNNTIRVYSAAGQFVKSIGSPGNGNGQLWHPCSLAIDPLASEIVVLDQQQIWDNYAKTWIDGARLQFFSTAGAFLRGYAKFGYDMNAGQLIKPVSVTVDAASRVYVSDARLQKVMVYNNTNALLGMVDNSAAPLRTPLGVAMGATGRLYVAALLSGRVDVYGLDSYSAMGVLPSSLSFTATEGDAAPAQQNATISNSGKADLAWSASTPTSWLSLPATGGVLQAAATGTVPVAVQHAGLAAGTYQGSVKVAAPGMAETVAVTLAVKPNPLQVSPAGLSFTASEGTTPAAQVLTVSTGGNTPVSWSASADQGWLFLSKSGGTGGDTVKVYANTASLGVGDYSGVVTVANLAGGKSVAVAVSLRITEATGSSGAPPDLPLPGEGEVKAGGKLWRTEKPAAGVTLRGAFGVDYRNAMAVGDNGTILAYNGKAWRRIASGTESSLQSIWIGVTAGSNAAYTVGDNGTALRSDGTGWSPVSTNTTEPLADVWGTTEVMAVGGYGTILNLSSNTAGAAGIVLRSVWGSTAADVFAVGESGAILHFDGTSWTAMDSDTSQWLNGVWGSKADDVFAVGENGAIVHYDGTGWTAMESGVYDTLHGVFGDKTGNVYAVGNNGTVLHYDGAAWNVLLAGGISLRDVWLCDRLVVAVGDDGTVLTGKAGATKGPGGKPKGLPPSGKIGTGDVLGNPSLKGPKQTR